MSDLVLVQLDPVEQLKKIVDAARAIDVAKAHEEQVHANLKAARAEVAAAETTLLRTVMESQADPMPLFADLPPEQSGDDHAQL